MQKNLWKQKCAALGVALSLMAMLPASALAVDYARTIPYPSSYDTKLDGASPYIGTMDIADSLYFTSPDYYNLMPNDHLTILPHYKTYQQTTGITCGPVAALTALHHFGATEYNELGLAGKMGTKDIIGTSTAGIVNFFKGIGWKVESSLTAQRFESLEDFLMFVDTQLKNNTPILVENIDWGGHWRTIIGYDTMGTATLGDDVLIMADSFDTSDHKQDGYVAVAAEKFFYMWFDAHMMPQGQKEQQWITVMPQ